MRYYKLKSPDGKVLSVGIAESGGVQITEEEYTVLLAEIREKASYVDDVYSGAITIDQVPEKWKAEVQEQVDQRKADDKVAAQSQISDAEFARMVEGVMQV